MNTDYINMMNQIHPSEHFENSIDNIPNHKIQHRHYRRFSKTLLVMVIVIAILSGSVLTANATLEDGIAGVFAGLPFFNNDKKYSDQFPEFILTEDEEKGNVKWEEKDGEWYCTVEGYPAEGFKLIDGYWYYFNGGWMMRDCSGPMGEFDTKGHWIYPDKTESGEDYDVTPAPINIINTIEDYINRHPVKLIVRKYEVAPCLAYIEDKEEHHYYVFGRGYGEDYTGVAVGDLFEYWTVSTNSAETIDTVADYLLSLPKKNHIIQPLSVDSYRLVFVFEDGMRDFISVRSDADGNCYYITQAGEIYSGNLKFAEKLFNSLEE